MGIQKLEIKGFLSLKTIQWEPSNLNVVIGPNGTGKSNLLRALGLLSRSADGALPKEVLASGGIMPLLWDRNAKTLEWKVKTDPVMADLLDGGLGESEHAGGLALGDADPLPGQVELGRRQRRPPAGRLEIVDGRLPARLELAIDELGGARAGLL